jgi:hypothetical protein
MGKNQRVFVNDSINKSRDRDAPAEFGRNTRTGRARKNSVASGRPNGDQ